MAELTGEFIIDKDTTPSSEEEVSSAQSSDSHSHPIYPGINRHNLRFFSSLCVDPKNISIINQDSDETVHLLVRRHWITNLLWILSIFVLSFIPILIPLFLHEFEFIRFSPTTIISGLLLYYLALFGYCILKFAEWYFHVGLVTNKRIVDVDLANILTKNVAETDIKQVEDVTFVQNGIIQSLFNFGNVFIQTEAVVANFEFDRIPFPSQVAEIVSQLAQHHKRGGRS